jgi:hypothetical protein
MDPILIAALIEKFALPELVAWLKARRGAPLTDADILGKLELDLASGIARGQAFLDAHP